MKGTTLMISLLTAVVGAYILLLIVMYMFQNKLLFMPSSVHVQTPESFGLTASDVWVETDDGETIHGWYFPNESAEFVVLLSHGNAGNIGGRISIAESLVKSGASVLLYDYRGYGKSTGKPSEAGFYSDIMAVIRYLGSELEVQPDQIILYGRSMGGAVAAYAATQIDAKGLVLDSAFLNVKEMIKDLYPFVPAFLASYDFPLDEYVKQIPQIPVMVMHSRDDEIVDFSHGRKVFELLEEPKMFVELQGGHNENFFESRETFEFYWHNYLDGLCGHCAPFMGTGLSGG